MTDRAAPPPLDELLARREWVRRFARTLARDEASADDLAQDAWVAAVEHPPVRATAPAGWFRRVLLRRAMNRARGERRRESRETAASRREAAPSTADVVAAAESHRRVVESVMALDEPYRTTILLRFFEDLPPRDVAARMDVPVETVRSRVRRAVEKLRARLDDQHDGRRAAWLVPLLGTGRRTTPPSGHATTGVLAMTTIQKTALAVAAVLLLGAGAAVMLRSSLDDPTAVARARSGAESPSAPRRSRARAERAADASEDVVAASDAPAAATPPADDGARELIVRVVDVRGEPASGVRVHLNVTGGRRGDSLVEVSDADGRAGFRGTGEFQGVWAEDLGQDGRAWRQRPASRVMPDAACVDLVVEQRAWIRGRVVGEDGKPIHQAEVWALAGDRKIWNGYSDARGEFRIAVPPDAAYDIALFGMIGGRPRNDESPELVAEVRGVDAGAKDVELVAKPATGKGRVRVRTVTSDGRPMADVLVMVSTPTDWEPYAYDRTDADGRLVCDGVPDRRIRVAVETKYGEPAPWEADGWVTPAYEKLVRPGDGEVTLVFEAGRPLRGRVEFPENYPRPQVPGMLAPRALVNVEEDGIVVARGYSGEDRRFSVLVPASRRGPFRLLCGVSGLIDGKHFDFHAEADCVPADAQDVLLAVTQRTP